MVEFALALPILLVALMGLLEVGRAVFMYAAITNASREAVRYATAYGVNESDVLQYQNCDAIRNAAKRVAFLLPLDNANIEVKYDAGPDDAGVTQPLGGDANLWDTQCAPDVDVNNGIDLACGDRVVVDVTYNYQPIIPILPIQAQTFTASSARTFTGVIELTDSPAPCN
jgi:Flp pilus assembly protein TadG